MNRLILLCALFAFMNTTIVSKATAEELVVLRTAAQHSPPKYSTLPNGSIGGIGIDVLRAIEKANPTLRFTGDQAYLPFARIQALLASGKLDIFVAIGFTEERSTQFDYIPEPLYWTRDGIFVLTKDPIVVKSLAEIKAIPDHRVIALQATDQLKELEDFGLNIDKSARNNETALRMLLGGRARFLYANEVALAPTARSLDALDTIRMVFVHERSARFIVLSKHLPPEIQNRLKQAVAELARSGELQRIIDRHLK